MEPESSNQNTIVLNPKRADLFAQKDLELIVDKVFNENYKLKFSKRPSKSRLKPYELVELSENEAIKILRHSNHDPKLVDLEDTAVMKKLFTDNPVTTFSELDCEFDLHAMIGGKQSCYELCTKFEFSKNTRGASVFIAHYLNRVKEATLLQFYKLQFEHKLSMDISPEYWFAIFLQKLECNDNKYFLLSKHSFDGIKELVCFSSLVQVQHQLSCQFQQPISSIIQKQKRYSIESIIKLVERKFLPENF